VAVTGNSRLTRIATVPYTLGGSYSQVAWSPDGNSLLFVGSNLDPNAQVDDSGVYMVISGRQPVRIARGIARRFPALWSLDGTEVAYAVFAGSAPGGPESVIQSFQIQAISPNGGQPRAVGTISLECGDVARIEF